MKPELAASILSAVGDFAGGAVVHKHWTEYGPTYVRAAVGKIPDGVIRECVEALGWNEEAWDFPSLDSILKEKT